MTGVTALRAHLDLFARRFTQALRQATRLRLPATDDGDDEPGASDAHLPGAGWVLGLAAAFSFALVALALRGSPWQGAAAAVLATMAVAALTGARPESALLRAAEALHGPETRGAGTVALVLLLAAKFALLAALASLTEPGVVAALFAGHVLARLAPLLLARSLDGVTPARAVHVGLLWCLVPLALLAAAAGLPALLLALVAATAASYGLWRLARGRPEAEHADLLAATVVVCEVAFYAGAAIGA